VRFTRLSKRLSRLILVMVYELRIKLAHGQSSVKDQLQKQLDATVPNIVLLSW